MSIRGTRTDAQLAQSGLSFCNFSKRSFAQLNQAGRMEHTKAPWAHPPSRDLGLSAAASAIPPVPNSSTATAEYSPAPGPRSGLRTTGRPVELVIQAEAKMPGSGCRPGQQFRPAERRIHNQADLRTFLKSNALKNFMGFLLALNEASQGQPTSAQSSPSAAIHGMVNIINTLDGWVDDIPPAKQALRYGNPAYRDWFDKIDDNANSLLLSVLPSELSKAAVELKPMLLDGFGNKTRIDYGTGHETTFCELLYCLAKLNVFTDSDRLPLVTHVFARYLKLMRKVQTTYWLEPAGSHGVWGLDDYQFLPFIWGSAQLIGHPNITPSSIHSQAVLDSNAEDYLYLGCIKFVKHVKKGPLAETSPMLSDISAVPTWAKVNSGMIKMYQVEVLSKFPIMQHFLFGSLFPFEDATALASNE